MRAHLRPMDGVSNSDRKCFESGASFPGPGSHSPFAVLGDSHSMCGASIDLDHSESVASVCNPFWPFTMLRAARGGIRRALINNLVASRTVEQSKRFKTE